MIFGIGTDIIEVSRIEASLTRCHGLKDKLFTAEEQRYCEGNAIVFQHYAARFAAKEAVFKALGTGYRGGMEFTDIEVKNDDLGKPVVSLSGEVSRFVEEHHIVNIQLSIAHVKDTAVAFVVMEQAMP